MRYIPVPQSKESIRDETGKQLSDSRLDKENDRDICVACVVLNNNSFLDRQEVRCFDTVFFFGDHTDVFQSP